MRPARERRRHRPVRGDRRGDGGHAATSWSRAKRDALRACRSAPFDPAGDRTLELSLRGWVKRADRFRDRLCRAALHLRRSRPRNAAGRLGGAAPDRVISVGYLALTPSAPMLDAPARAGAPGTISFRGKIGATAVPRMIDDDDRPRLQGVGGRRATSPTRAAPRAAGFALEGAVVERRARARALRVALRSRPRAGSRARSRAL